MGLSITFTGLTELQKKIDDYAKQFPNKMELFLQRLMEVGIPVVDRNYNRSMSRVTTEDYSLQHSNYVEVTNNGDTIVAKLIVEGKDVAFVEFGAGIYFHTEGHPLESEFGMGVGTYPNQTHAFDPFWWYIGEDGVKHFSRGIGAQMPVFKAGQEMLNKFDEIAREIFEF